MKMDNPIKPGPAYIIVRRISLALMLGCLAIGALLQVNRTLNVRGQAPNVPARYYGEVQSSALVPSFVPVVGMEVEAFINGQVCGQSQTEQHNGQIVYSIDVLADTEVAGIAGCGQSGDTVTFFVDQVEMSPVAIWDNAQLNNVDLMPQTGASSSLTAPVLVEPLGELSTSAPQYKWEVVESVDNYTLVVYDVGNETIVISNTYTAASICDITYCIVQSSAALGAGSYTWLARGFNINEYGPWGTYEP